MIVLFIVFVVNNMSERPTHSNMIGFSMMRSLEHTVIAQLPTLIVFCMLELRTKLIN